MIVTSAFLKEKMQLANKNNKISREAKSDKLFKLKNGLYETNGNTPGYLLAGSIFGPSYLSFEFALSYHGLIPERVVNYTSATYDKKKKKKYINHFGTFLYRDVPKQVYSIEVYSIIEGEYSYQIATAEKALCDKLYTLNPLCNFNNLKKMLYEDLRIEKEALNKLDINKIKIISNNYHSTNVNLLYKYMEAMKK